MAEVLRDYNFERLFRPFRLASLVYGLIGVGLVAFVYVDSITKSEPFDYRLVIFGLAGGVVFNLGPILYGFAFWRRVPFAFAVILMIPYFFFCSFLAWPFLEDWLFWPSTFVGIALLVANWFNE